MEPLLPEDRQELEDLGTDLVAKANTLAGRLQPVMRASVGDLVRSMNCYYSNLIEGHNTLPIDIDRALNNDLAKEPERRNLQLEARAHIEVQRLIDRGEAPSPALLVDFHYLDAQKLLRAPARRVAGGRPSHDQREDQDCPRRTS